MAILRAGPWGNLDSPHEDEPAVKEDQTNIFPVNCAKVDWPNQPWKLLYTANSDITIETETAALGSSIVSEGVIYATVFINFNWQATEDFEITLQWDITSSQGFAYPTLDWQITTIEGTSEYFFDTPAESGTMDITLPASIFGHFRASVDGTETYVADIRTEASIS